MTIVLFIAGLLISICGSLRDGISDRRPNIGWVSWHVLGWLARDIALCLIMIPFVEHERYLLVVILLLSRTLHNQLCKFAQSSSIFIGRVQPPKWWKVINKILDFFIPWR